MSVKGFSVNGAVEQYDAESLANVGAILDATLTQSGKAADAAAVGDLKRAIAISQGDYVYAPEISATNCYINNEGELTSSTIQEITKPLPVEYGRMYRLVLNVITAFNLRIVGCDGNATDTYNAETFVKILFLCTKLTANSTMTIDFIVNDPRIKNVIICKRVNAAIVSLADIGPYDDEGLHLRSMPNIRAALYAVKRARQFTDIAWTPRQNLPRTTAIYNDDFARVYRFDDQFLDDVTYRGLPYSHGNTTELANFGYSYGHIGYDVPISAFITSLYYPNSFFNTKSTRISYDKPTAYGVTCDVLVCYAFSFGKWWGSNSGFNTLINDGSLVERTTVDDLDDKAVEIGEALVKIGTHVALITDLIRDENGTITYIEVSEATTKGVANDNIIGGAEGGKCWRKTWNRADFQKCYEGYTIYQFNGLYKSTYTPTPYVAVGNDPDQSNLYVNMPIIPYMGEGFVYKSGKIYNNTLLSQAANYAYIAVYKDDALFNTYDYASVLPVPFTAAGQYKAFLFNGTIDNITERSLACHWTVA